MPATRYVINAKANRSSRTRAGWLLGVGLLVLGFFTKQTTLIYALAAVLALAAQGRHIPALLTGLGTAGILALIVLIITATSEPRFLESILAEASTPRDLVNWSHTLSRLVKLAPELPLLSLLGLWLWNTSERREPAWTVLVIVLTAASVAACMKRGSDLNYFMGMRLAAALSLGTLCHGVKRRWLGCVPALAVVAITLAPSVMVNLNEALAAQWRAAAMKSASGRAIQQHYQRIFAIASDPARHILTDSGPIDIRQGTRSLFADPWLFHMLAETGRIDTKPLESLVDRLTFDLIVTTHDLFADDYESYSQGLPIAVATRVRRLYRPIGVEAGFFYYIPRDRKTGAAEPIKGRGFRTGS